MGEGLLPNQRASSLPIAWPISRESSLSSKTDEQAALRMRLKELAATRVHYGYRRLHILLRREG